MKTSKTYRLSKHTLYQINGICERDKCSATQAVEKAIDAYRIMQMIVDDNNLKDQRYYSMIEALTKRGG